MICPHCQIGTIPTFHKEINGTNGGAQFQVANQLASLAHRPEGYSRIMAASPPGVDPVSALRPRATMGAGMRAWSRVRLYVLTTAGRRYGRGRPAWWAKGGAQAPARPVAARRAALEDVKKIVTRLAGGHGEEPNLLAETWWATAAS